MDLWIRDPEAYRRRYYTGEPYFSTPYTRFGNEVGGALEDRNWDAPCLAPVLNNVPQLTSPEHKLAVEVAGVPLLGYMDDFNPDTLEILEYKTGIRDRKGAPPWDRVKVRNHKQLTWYTMCVRQIYGSFNPDIKLVWLETEWALAPDCFEHEGTTYCDQQHQLRLTGHVQTFDRHIKEWELDRLEMIIRKNAEAISKDYEQWKQQ